MTNPCHREAGGFIPALRGKGKVAPSAFLRWLLTGNLLTIAILLALVGLILSRDKETYREAAIQSTRNLGQVLEQNIAALLAKTDVSLQTVAHEVVRQSARGSLDEGALNELLARQQSLLPELSFLRIADGEGNIRYGRQALPAHRTHVADRSFYIEARRNADAGLIIEGPVRLQTTQRWTIFVGRRLNRADGGFLGVVYAAIDSQHFQDLFSRMDLGAGSAIALRTADMRLIAHHPIASGGSAAIGATTIPPELKEAIAENPKEGNYVARSPLDGVERIVSYFRIGDRPFYIIVGLATENYLVPWRVGVMRISALTALVILVIALSSWMAYALWRRQWLAAESLGESEKRFRLMVESIRDYAVFMLDAEAKVATWNEGAARLTGYSAEEIIGRSLSILYPDSMAGEWNSTGSLPLGGPQESVTSENWRLRKSGALFMANTVITAMRDDKGTLRGFTVILRDVSEQRLAEQAAKKANALLLEAVDSIAVGFSIYDPDDRLVICNQAYRNIYRTSGEFIVPGVKFEEQVRYGAERGQYPEAEEHPDVWIRDRVRRHCSANGTPLEQQLDDGRHLLIVEYRTPSGHIVGNHLDITELHRHQHHLEQLVEARTAELRDSEVRFRSAFEQAAVGLAHVSLDGRLLRVNEKLCDIVGYSREELLDIVFQDLSPPACVSAPLEEAGKLLVQDDAIPSYAQERRYRRKDGSLVWVNVTTSLVRDPAGQADHLVAVVEDIQRRKEAELALAEEREARQQILEQQVAERTAELVAANRELQGFTYAASHDLKAPLGRINSFSALLEMKYRDKLEGDGLLFLDFIRRNAVRMNTLIEDLLAHAQIEQKILDLQPMNVAEAIQAALKERAGELQQGGVQLWLDLPEITVRANPHGLAQVLGNLLENAIKYSGQAKPPVIEIGAREESGRCRLWVRDNGVGFDMVYHDRIFEIFRRLHTYEEFPGSGVGLALVRKAMERMGGRVWADSTPGRGATFYLELALAKCPVEAAPEDFSGSSRPERKSISPAH